MLGRSFEKCASFGVQKAVAVQKLGACCTTARILDVRSCEFSSFICKIYKKDTTVSFIHITMNEETGYYISIVLKFLLQIPSSGTVGLRFRFLLPYAKPAADVNKERRPASL